ncbi:MAG: NAD-dependent epimerase/dehydratase family protein [Candidatus Eisenbacteria bacterium]|nr:NAD-dependent epimerase/dehydratase family protein [Candidatus Eisenbacteria bacterium]
MTKGNGEGEVRTLVVGAGSAGAMVVGEMACRPEHGFVVAGFLDDDPAKMGTTVSGVPVLGPVSDLVSVVEEHDIQQIVIAIPSASGRTIRDVVRLAEETGRPFMIVPGVWEILLGDVEISQIRQVQLDDLLGRETVVLDTDEMTDYVRGRSVLVTGAGGSIGSELVRQVASFRPGLIVLMGRGENSVYEIDLEISMSHPDVERVALVGSVTNPTTLESAFRRHEPDVVFHAAAHKHVHLMESYPEEAIRNNVTGTKTLVDTAVRHGTERLVMLSTDKAVRPHGIMGASKRLAELLLIDRARSGSPTKLVAVRFGNVLGSRGSVVPMFKSQIRHGGPLTVTHPDVTRYFMTIREAAMLVLEAGFLGEGGEIFVLDMGDPIRISELAEHLIRLSGMEPGKDIAIEYCGLRPGEKLHEELWTADEDLQSTRHPKISVVRPGSEREIGEVRQTVTELEELAETGDREALVRRLAQLFPDISTERNDER